VRALGAVLLGFAFAWTLGVLVAVQIAPAAPQEPTEVIVAVPAEVQRSAKHSFALFTQPGLGHGCAVDGLALTNNHVVLDDVGEPMGFRYSFTGGPSGHGFVDASATTADIAILELANPPGIYAVRAMEPPNVGDTITWVEYDWREPADAFKDRHRSAKVLRLVGGAIIMDEVPVSGASGGCAYNAAGEVVGLVTFSIAGAGGVTGIWGPWGAK